VQVADFQGGRGLGHVGSSLKCARWLPANAKLAQRLKDNHRRIVSSVEALDGLSHPGSGRSHEGKHHALQNRDVREKGAMLPALAWCWK
ncbi:hypothetical protein, partial [Pseudomonas syringae]